jgi:hypothetical protein
VYLLNVLNLYLIVLMIREMLVVLKVRVVDYCNMVVPKVLVVD